MTNQSRILVVGALTMDRLLYVDKYPKPDSKSSCTSHECGGGNAANTASCIGNLCFDSPIDCEIQLLSKVSSDPVGKRLCDELLRSNVNLSSPLFIRSEGKPSISTVIVTCDDSHTRTCIFDPGTIGTLNNTDCESIDYDELFYRVNLLHSDTRHTDAAVRLAREAKRRGIRVSIDVERDRNSIEFDELITGEDLMQSIVRRRWSQMNISAARDFASAVAQLCHQLSFVANTYIPKELIVTRGEKGACHCKLMTSNHVDEDSKVVDIKYCGVEGSRIQYVLRYVGSARDVKVVDTTGAGDSFIGGFLFASQFLSSTDGNVFNDQEKIMFQLRLASWVAARKISGHGARGRLPTWHSVEMHLGSTAKTIHKKLQIEIRTGES
jgi:sugar/nucleoside kinase (ribokinase family)